MSDQNSVEDDEDITVNVYDLTNDQDVEPGFYYEIPIVSKVMIEAANKDAGEIYLRGPFDTAEEAIEAAHAFIEDALNNWENEE